MILLAWECLVIPQKQLESVDGERDIWVSYELVASAIRPRISGKIWKKTHMETAERPLQRAV